MELPKDDFMLLSFLNTKLRDEYKNLDALCEDLEVSKTDLIKRMKLIGYDCGECRLPLTAMSEQNLQRLSDLLK